MNCKRIEKLIPAYLEGDLEASLNEVVRPHVKACRRCGELADKLRDVQGRLRSYKAPDFSGVFFDEVRQAVLRKIEGLESTDAPFRSLAGHLGGNAALLASLFLACIFGANALYYDLTDGSSNVGPSVAGLAPGANNEEAAEMMAGAERRETDEATARETGRQRQTIGRSARRRALAAGRAELALELSAEQSDDFQPAVKNRLEQEELTGQGLAAAQFRRMDIETGDPTVHIIWFSRKEDDPASEADADES